MTLTIHRFSEQRLRSTWRFAIPIGTAVLVVVIASTALAGWWLGISQLTSIVPDWPTMKFNAALAALQAALALLLAGLERRRGRAAARPILRAAGSLLAFGTLMFGLLILAEHTTGVNFGLDQFFIPDSVTVATRYPGRPAPATALGLSLAGMALLGWRFPRALSILSCCAGVIVGLAWLSLTGLLYGVQEKAATVFFGTVSLPTSLCFFVLGSGLLFLRPAEGLARLFTSPHHAGRLSRRLIPAALALALGLGELQLWAQYHWRFSTELGVALYGTGMVISLTLIALRGAWLVDRLDLRRRRSEEEKKRELEAREKALQQLQESERRLAGNEELLRQFIKHAPAAIAMLDENLRYVQASDRWLKDYHLDGQNIVGRSHYEVFPDIPQRWKEIHQRVLAGAVEHCDEDSFPRADGGVEWLQWEAHPWRKAGGEIGGVVFYTQVITARKKSEAKLRESEERFRGAFENSAVGMALVGLDGRWLRVNAALCEIVGRSEEELFACTFQDITHPDDLGKDLAQVRAMIAGETDHYQMQKRYFHKSGRIVWILLAATLVRDSEGRPLHFVSQIKDITDRHEAAERMRASLEEKEVLLREIHHRVKNNLQVITSLLQLQSGYLHDPRDEALFKECQARIHAMGLVHDRLYRSGNLSTIDFSEHLRELTALIVRGQSNAPERIRVALESDPVEVNLDIAIPLGLITAELIANAYKHAFRGGISGVINVRLSRSAEQELTLAVADNGIGLPHGFDPEKARSLGLRLIRALSRQLRAVFSIATSDSGTTMRLIFPL